MNQSNEQKYAELTGFEPEAETVELESNALLDDDEMEPFEPEESGWAANPRFRLGIVAAGAGLAALCVAYLVGGFSPSTPQAGQEETPSAQTEETGSGDETAALREKNAELQTKLALRNQEQLAKTVEGEKSKEKSQPKAAAKPQATLPPAKLVAPQRAPRSPVAAARPIPLPPPPVIRSVAADRPSTSSLPARVPPPQAVPPPPVAIASPEFSSKPPSNPAEQLAETKRLGSYGQGKEVAPNPPMTAAGSDSVPNNALPTAVSVQARSELPPSVVAGSTAQATLETPLFLSGAGRGKDEPVVVVVLAEPLGRLPSGTKFIGRATQVDGSSGRIRVALTAVMQAGWEQPLAEGALWLRGQAGEPLVAQSLAEDRGGNEVLGDIGLTVLSGVARGATRDLTREIGNDLIAGVLEEVSDEVFDNLQERNKAATVRLPATQWHLPQGTAVQVFVNRSLALEGATPEPPETLPMTEAKVPAATPVSIRELPEPSSLPTTAHSGVSAPEAFSTPEFSPPSTPPKLLSRQPRKIVEAPVVKVWAGSGTNINFLAAGETITRAWLDDPSMVTLDFDRSLCAPEAQGCTTGRPSIVHLRWIEGIELSHLPSADSTLLTVMTQTPNGEERLYAFRIERSSGQPEYHTVEMPTS